MEAVDVEEDEEEEEAADAAPCTAAGFEPACMVSNGEVANRWMCIFQTLAIAPLGANTDIGQLICFQILIRSC